MKKRLGHEGIKSTVADEIIARGLSRAMKSTPRSISEIWTEFDTVRAKIGQSNCEKDERKNQNKK